MLLFWTLIVSNRLSLLVFNRKLLFLGAIILNMRLLAITFVDLLQSLRRMLVKKCYS